ncbi:protein-export membrane protein SecF [Candidatus Wolfebacteria bacterium RIFCSPHIGHO2_01_FULL_48_22]|uniref:Protein-export membrane protein SecF n=2 Tax=Candidatus Wolfeibacteriota TaxID=1752735 RepID=A0A1F8DUR2_9BACT|nr:MAG: protein-export membrane protein SecF [Candidatus Wolfebacteria bacterium RIFCSPHIGHO2_01_FULL_48_22]OGM93915.1 MAG: protein-export membrane protein SecF [Candidatus Wolfebacteria bacterium RIFCSPLOWO2_01_FULL_47_17b]
MDIIKHKWIFLGFSGVLVLASAIAIVLFGLRPAIDFTGGTLWQIRIPNTEDRIQESQIIETLVEQGIENPSVLRETSSDSFLIKTKPLSEAEHQQILSALEERVGSVEELRFESIGPTIGSQLRSKAIWAGILVLLAISVYIAISFRKVSYPVQSWKYGLTTLITLFHDVVIPTGILAVLGEFGGVEIDTNFIVALLVIMGFSVHDTIVVFDRVREQVLARHKNESFTDTVNASVRQTIARSVNTSFTLVLMLVAMLVFGSSTLQLFVGILLVGTVIGTYSSICVASPLLTVWGKLSKMASHT